jgi:hypothetical protein
MTAAMGSAIPVKRFGLSLVFGKKGLIAAWRPTANLALAP